MHPALKFIYISLPLVAFGMIFLLIPAFEEPGLPPGKDRVILVVWLVLLVINALIYRRHVKRNRWIKWADRYRYMKAVTVVGPFGQALYFFQEIYPYDQFREDPPKDMTDDSRLTDADQLF